MLKDFQSAALQRALEELDDEKDAALKEALAKKIADLKPPDIKNFHASY